MKKRDFFVVLLTFFALTFFCFSCFATQTQSWRNCQCGRSRVTGRIVGGKEATPHIYPWTVALKDGFNKSGVFCSGTLISSKHVLTAAHCVQNPLEPLAFSAFELVFGLHERTGDGTTVKVTRMPLIHPKFERLPYTESLIYDLALIELDHEVPLSNHVQPICLFPNQIENHDELRWDLDDPQDDPHDDGSIEYVLNKLRNLMEERRKARQNEANSNLNLKRKKRSENDQAFSFSSNFAAISPMKIVPLEPNIHNAVEGADQGRMSQLIVAGWGIEDPNDYLKMSDVLKEAVVVEREDEWCIDEFGPDAFNSQIQICAHGIEQDSCDGDSGSALMRRRNGRMFQVGITSYGRGCGAGVVPGIYTRVSAFMDWILYEIRYDSVCR